MDNSSPRTDQSVGRFRVARNVLPTPDGKLIPRSELAAIPGQPSDMRYIHYYTPYGVNSLSIASANLSGSLIKHLYKDSVRVPAHIGVFGPPEVDELSLLDSESIMSFRKNNTVFFLDPWNNLLGKYDGVELSSAGCQQPILSCAQYVPSGGTKIIRVIQHCIDFDRNEPVSEYVQFETTAATTIKIRNDGATTNLIGSTAVLPTAVIPPRSPESPYFWGTSTYNAGTQDYSITTTDTNIVFSYQIGSYVIVAAQLTPTSVTGLPEDALGVALKVKSISPLVLAATDARYLSLQREWKTGTVGNATFALGIRFGSRNFFSIWASTTYTGNYVFRGFMPSFPHSSTNQSASTIFDVNVSSVVLPIAGSGNTIFNISPNLGDWYDVSTRKLSPNAIYPYGDRLFYGITAFQDQMILWSDDLLWYSDPTLAGSFEQLNTSSFLRAGDSEFGLNVSCCGTQNMLFISRERKNYNLVGTISTGNYRVEEIEEAEIGAWTNNATVNVKNSIILITATSVYQVTNGGGTVDLGKLIPKNFSRYNGYTVDEDVKFILNGTNVLYTSSPDIGLSVAYDEYRELLVFMQKGSNIAGNPCLVLHTATGEFYEWTGLVNTGAFFASAIGFVQSKMYVGRFNPTAASLTASTFLEDFSATLNYPTTSPIQLYSTWMTAGEPSLEKELLQLKMFGTITPSLATSINVVHFKDWDIVTKLTNVVYTPPTSGMYSHKKRLNSDKVLAASCGFEVTASEITFQLESLEVEFNPIQQGMKR